MTTVYLPKWFGPPGPVGNKIDGGKCGPCGCWWCDDPTAITIGDGTNGNYGYGYNGGTCCDLAFGTYAVDKDISSIFSNPFAGACWIQYAFTQSNGLKPVFHTEFPADYNAPGGSLSVVSGYTSFDKSYLSACVIEEGYAESYGPADQPPVTSSFYHGDIVTIQQMTVTIAVGNIKPTGGIARPRVSVSIKYRFYIHGSMCFLSTGCTRHWVEMTENYMRDLTHCNELLSSLSVPFVDRTNLQNFWEFEPALYPNGSDPAFNQSLLNLTTTGFNWGWSRGRKYGYDTSGHYINPFPYRYTFCEPAAIRLVF